LFRNAKPFEVAALIEAGHPTPVARSRRPADDREGIRGDREGTGLGFEHSDGPDVRGPCRPDRGTGATCAPAVRQTLRRRCLGASASMGPQKSSSWSTRLGRSRNLTEGMVRRDMVW